MNCKKDFKRVLHLVLIICIVCIGIAKTTVNSSAYGYNEISNTSIILTKGESKKIKLLWSEDSTIKWSTSNKKVATVKNGKITAKKKGKATITAKVEDRDYRCKVTVEEPYISKKSITISVGESYKLKMKGTTRYPDWSSSKKSVVAVASYSYGEVTGKKKGTAYVTAKIGKKKYKCKVKVEEPKLSADELEFLLDDKPKQIRLNGTSRKIKWSTSDKSVATVKNGTVTPKGKGCCVIYAKVGNMEYRCWVDVKNEMNTVYIPMGKSWNVPGQWNIRINSVEETSYRSEYSDYNPEAVYVLEYTYRNLGYEDVEGLRIDLDWPDAIVDNAGKVAYHYYYDTTWYPQKLPVGAYCTAEASIGVDHRGDFKIYYNMYDNENTLRKAVFEIEVPN